MNNCKKKTTVVTVIFCILLVLGIVLSLALDLNIASREANKVRSVSITFTGTLKSSDLQSKLEEKLEGFVVLNEKDKVVTTTTTTKATTTTTTKATTTAATTTAATTEANGSTTAAATTTTTTKATTTTTAASATDFKSGKAVATVGDCDEKTDAELKAIFEEVFATKEFKDNNLAIVEIAEVEVLAGLSGAQIYACVIVLIVVFVFCLIRFYSMGALASAVSVIAAAVAAIAASVGAALICNTFSNIDVSGVAAVAAAACVIFCAIVLENVKNETKNDCCTISGIAAVVAVLLILIAIVSVIAWNGEIAFSCIQYALAIIISAISALVYVRCVFDMFVPNKNNNKKKTTGKKPVIR